MKLFILYKNYFYFLDFDVTIDVSGNSLEVSDVCISNQEEGCFICDNFANSDNVQNDGKSLKVKARSGQTYDISATTPNGSILYFSNEDDTAPQVNPVSGTMITSDANYRAFVAGKIFYQNWPWLLTLFWNDRK